MNSDALPRVAVDQKVMMKTLPEDLVEQICTFLDPPERAVLEALARADQPLTSKELMELIRPDLRGALATIRDNVKDLRHAIDVFSLRPEGLAHSLKVMVKSKNKDGYCLEFTAQDANCKKFWKPYLRYMGKDKPVLIVYAEPAFYRIHDRAFLRHQDSNFARQKSIQEACPWASLPIDQKLEPSTNYVSSGDVDAALILTRWFERLGIPTEHMTAKQWASTKTNGQHSILLGCGRIFPEIETDLTEAELSDQTAFTFRVRDHFIENLKPKATEQPSYPDNSDPTNPVRAGNGVVYRFFSKRRASGVTLFASNHSRFFEAAIRALTDEHFMEQFWKEVEMENAVEPPRRFELLGTAALTPSERYVRSRTIEWIGKRGFERADVEL